MQKRKSVIIFALALIIWVVFGGSKADATEVSDSGSSMAEQFQEQGTHLNETEIEGLAIGCTKNLSLEPLNVDPSTFQITYSSDNSGIASVNSDGLITANAVGMTNIHLDIQFSDQSSCSYTCEITVTDPHFSQSNYIVAIGNSIRLQIDGTTTNDYNLSSSDPSVATVDGWGGSSVEPLKVGTATITATVDGRQIRTTVQVTNPQVAGAGNLKLLVKGKSSSIKVSGASGTTPITYQVANPKIASVSANGKIKAKKYGSTTIQISVDNMTFNMTIAVGNKKTVGAINNAKKALGKPYSQAKRMKKGYYDCSSLVWKSYKPYKVYFGDKKYAPTAANQAKYLVKKKQVVAKKYVSTSKLRPGDVLYFTKGNNGRYKGIYHTAIYIGGDLIIHANGYQVAYGSYSSYRSRIAIITRPAK